MLKLIYSRAVLHWSCCHHCKSHFGNNWKNWLNMIDNIFMDCLFVELALKILIHKQL